MDRRILGITTRHKRRINIDKKSDESFIVIKRIKRSKWECARHFVRKQDSSWCTNNPSIREM